MHDPSTGAATNDAPLVDSSSFDVGVGPPTTTDLSSDFPPLPNAEDPPSTVMTANVDRIVSTTTHPNASVMPTSSETADMMNPPVVSVMEEAHVVPVHPPVVPPSEEGTYAPLALNDAGANLSFLTTSPEGIPYPTMAPAPPQARDAAAAAAATLEEVPMSNPATTHPNGIILVQNSTAVAQEEHPPQQLPPQAATTSKRKPKPQREDTPRKQQRDAKWSIMYNYLLQYKELHGNCLVPNRYKPLPQLGNWVSTQRRHYSAIGTGGATPLSAEKVELLNKVGFVWKTKDPRHVSAAIFGTGTVCLGIWIVV